MHRLDDGRLIDLVLGHVHRRSILRLATGVLLVKKLITKVVVFHLTGLLSAIRFLAHLLSGEEVLSLL